MSDSAVRLYQNQLRSNLTFDAWTLEQFVGALKVLSLNELIGYIQYFDQTLNGEEVKGIFEYLKKRMQKYT